MGKTRKEYLILNFFLLFLPFNLPYFFIIFLILFPLLPFFFKSFFFSRKDIFYYIFILIPLFFIDLRITAINYIF